MLRRMIRFQANLTDQNTSAGLETPRGRLRHAALAVTVVLATTALTSTGFAAGPAYLTLEESKSAADAARSTAASMHHAIAIAIVDAGGLPIYEERADPVPGGMAEAALAKAKTAALYGLSTKAMGDFIAKGAMPLMALPHALPLEGGVPLFIAGRVIGAIGVAGSDSPSDESAARAGAARLVPTITDFP